MKTFLSKAFNLPALQKNRLQWVDYLKGIAIILVVYRHALIGIERSGLVVNEYLVNANMIFYSFRMPLFFLLSGIFVQSSLERRTLQNFIGKKFELLLYPYLVWTVLQITLQIVLGRFTNAGRTWADYAYIIYQPRELDQFWYLPALFNTTLLYVLVKTKLKPAAWVQCAMGLLFYFARPYLGKISMLTDWMEFYFFFALGDAMGRAFFSAPVQRVLKNPLLLLPATPLFVFAQVYFLRHTVNDAVFLLVALTGCFFMLLIAFQLEKLHTAFFLRVLGYHSLYIYVMHVMVTALVRIVLTRLGIHQTEVLLFAGIAGGVTIPVVVYNYCVRDGFAWFLFSYHKNKPAARTGKEITPAAWVS